jgi:type II secretory pathway component PulC
VKRTISIAVTASLAIGLLACASQYKTEAKQEQQAEQMRTQPVNCATAQRDLQTLQNEKVNTAKQAEAGASAILPIGLVAGLVTGTEDEKGQVAIGDYNQALDKAIAHIKSRCNIQ